MFAHIAVQAEIQNPSYHATYGGRQLLFLQGSFSKTRFTPLILEDL